MKPSVSLNLIPMLVRNVHPTTVLRVQRGKSVDKPVAAANPKPVTGNCRGCSQGNLEIVTPHAGSRGCV